jgi:hypothetical protein
MKFFLLTKSWISRDWPPQWIIVFPSVLPRKLEFLNGKRALHLWNPKYFAFSHTIPSGIAEKLDYPGVAGSWSVCSQRMADLISQFDKDAVEFLPFRTRNSIGEDVTTHYRVMNCLRWIAAVDKRKSALRFPHRGYKLTEDRDYLLDKVVIDVRKLNVPFCRIEGWPLDWVVRSDLLDALNAAGITGLRIENLPIA